jgi:hypothetical protein
MRRTPVLGLVLALALVACGGATSSPAASAGTVPAPGVDPRVAALILANGQEPTGPTTFTEVVIGDLRDAPWAQYLEVSRRVGLDFTAGAGRSATLARTPLRGRFPDAALFVLLQDGRVAGAWVSAGGDVGGVLPITERP